LSGKFVPILKENGNAEDLNFSIHLLNLNLFRGTNFPDNPISALFITTIIHVYNTISNKILKCEIYNEEPPIEILKNNQSLLDIICY